jgi:alkaline phosphatase
MIGRPDMTLQNRTARRRGVEALFLLTLVLAFGCGGAAPQAPAVKNVILFIGDGMSLASEISLSRYLYNCDRGLAWHSFGTRAYVATWDVTAYNRNAKEAGRPPYREGVFAPALGFDAASEGRAPHPLDTLFMARPAPLKARPSVDSAAAATAMATGRKTDSGRISWRPGPASGGPMRTLLEDYRETRGGTIGVASTVPFNHATPAPFVSHNVSRAHYYTGYKERPGQGIADEIVRSTKPDVVIGGGHPLLDNPALDPGKGYISAGLLDELRASEDYVFVERRPGEDGGRALLDAAERAVSEGRKLFGLFGGPGGNFETPVASDAPGAPDIRRATVENPLLLDVTLAALRVLSRDPDGFFVMIEQGDIDWAHHDNDFGLMIGAMSDLEEAVRAAVAYIDLPGDAVDWTNTLLIVTADHATGGFRLNEDRPLGIGDLPRQSLLSKEELTARRKAIGSSGYVSQHVYPDGEVSYGTSGHSNELVTLSARGAGARLFVEFKGLWYPGPIIDNTQINAVIRAAFGLAPLPRRP